MSVVFVDGTLYFSSSTQITKLKIDNNPFAKGFRDNGLNRKRWETIGHHKKSDGELFSSFLSVQENSPTYVSFREYDSIRAD